MSSLKKDELFSVYCVEHANINEKQLRDIVSIKKNHWKYTTESHLEWINENIKENDKHLMIYKKDKLIAYMNMVNINLTYGELCYKILGIGNVCVDINNFKKRIGSLLMETCNFYLNDNGVIGILLCKNELKSFYLKNEWKIYENKLFINGSEFTNNVLFSNDKFLNLDEVMIDRLF